MPAIKVKELIELLKTLPQDYDVILSKDSEGNAFSPMPNDNNYCLVFYAAETTWHGDIYGEEDYLYLNEYLIEKQEKTKEEIKKEYKRKENAVVLWPTN